MAKEVKQKHWGTLKVLEKWETANPNGRPKKGISLVNEQLKKEWYDPAKKVDIEDAYMSLINLDETKLNNLLLDKNQPMLIRIIIKAMLGWKWFDIIERMLDRGIGKATQWVQVTWKDWKDLFQNINVSFGAIKEWWCEIIE